MPKRYLTGEGKDLKNQNNSNSYPSKNLKNLKYFANKFLKKIRNLNKILTLGVYDRIGGVGSRAQKGSGASVFGLFIYQTVCRKISKIVSDAKRKPLDRCTLIPPAGASCRGSILIEFAVCMPVLIILLFYIHDLVRIKRYYSQTEFVAQQMANIIQNISQRREDKKITTNDLKYAASLAFLSMYPGNTMYHTDKRSSSAHELSHQPEFFVYYVKGLPGGKASCVWVRYIWCDSGTTPTGWAFSSQTSIDRSRSIVRWKTEAEPSAIYPTLKINEGEVKIIIEVTPWCSANTMSTSDYNASDNQSTRAKKAFRCRLVTPKVRGSNNYFNSAVIFTPKPGLFDETAPK